MLVVTEQDYSPPATQHRVPTTRGISMRPVNKVMAVAVAAALVLAACGGDDDDTTSDTAAPVATDAPDATDAPTATDAPDAPAATDAPDSTEAPMDDPIDALYQECLADGAQVNLIALPDEWANYKGILASFGEKYPGVELPGAEPERLLAGRARRDRQPVRPARHARRHRRQPRQGADRDRRGFLGAVRADQRRRDSCQPEGSGRELDRRLLRRHFDRHQHHDRGERPDDVRRPGQAGVQGPGRSQRRPAHLWLGLRCGHGGVDRQRRQRRRHLARHPVLRRPEGLRQPDSRLGRSGHRDLR